LEDIKGFGELVESKIEKVNYRIGSVHDKLELKIDGARMKLEAMVREQDRKMYELRESMSNSLD
jgi:hypothetical protein